MFYFENLYKQRRNKICDFMKKNNIAACIFEDKEECREPSLRYLSGHTSDAILILLNNGRNFLIPWDYNLALQKAHAEKILPYTDFERNNFTAIKSVLKQEALPRNSKIAIPPSTSYINWKKYKDELKEFKILCSENSVHNFVIESRAIKDEYEIECTKKACSITDQMTQSIIEMVKSNKIKTETDVALFIERELRNQNCEKTSFDTLAAGPSRSFAIHAFPGYTKNEWATEGLSILDYGVCYEGYASDCTITIARGKINSKQREILETVQKAFDSCLKLYKANSSIKKAALKAEEIFSQIGRSMPHSLGHGTGLEIHEAPFISTRADEAKLFKAGNIVTLEPGLYDSELGGCRLENDILITEDGNQVLTNSKIFYL